MGEPKLEGVKTALKICQGIKIGGQCPNSCPLIAACQMGCGGAPRMILDCIQQLEAERDALIGALKRGDVCSVCKYEDLDEDQPPCATCCGGRSCWEWRGVKKEE